MMAEATGTPHLDLSFQYHPRYGTWLDRRVFRWPYTLARCFRIDAAPADMLTLILQTVSGTIQADDRLVQRIHVGHGATVHVTTQGATPVCRAAGGLCAEDHIALDVENDGCLEYMPGLRILFPDSRLAQHLCVRLADSATAIIADGFVTHDPDGIARPFRAYRSELLLQRPDGTLLAVDRCALDGPPRASGRRASYVAHGTLMVAVRRPEALLQALCADVEARLGRLPGLYAAGSLLPNGAGASFRLAAIDGRHLRLGLQAAWGGARLHLFGAEPGLRPRFHAASY